MKKKINQKVSIEQLKFENELEKIRLNLKYGIDINENPEDCFPPEIERDFLKYVDQFETASSNSELITIYEFIGQPDFRKPNEISEENVSVELEKLKDFLFKNRVSINSLCPVSDSEMYRFITEEIFNVLVEDIKMSGIYNVFCYEEFHPNDDYDIRKSCTEFIETLFNKEREFDASFNDLAFELLYRDEIVLQDEFIQRLNEFRDSFSEMSLNKFEINSVTIDDDKSSVCFDVAFSMTIEGTIEKTNISGTGEIGLFFDFGFWGISSVGIPGICF